MTLKMAQVAVREVPSMKHSVRHSKALYVLNTGIECQHQPCLLVDVTYLLPLNITDPTDLSWMVLWGLAPPRASASDFWVAPVETRVGMGVRGRACSASSGSQWLLSDTPPSFMILSWPRRMLSRPEPASLSSSRDVATCSGGLLNVCNQRGGCALCVVQKQRNPLKKVLRP